MKDMTKKEMKSIIDEMEEVLCYLEDRLSNHKIKPKGRKEQVLKCITNGDYVSVSAMAERIGISARNISSQLTYLRKDGYAIATDSLGKKFLEV